MIAFIKGILADVTENTVVIESGGIGYEIFVPQTVYGIIPEIGGELKLHTYMQVREDDISLFGFRTKDDLNVFKLLITVSGIGPKGAVGILSAMSADDLRFAVMSDDAKAIAKAPGIGAKTAGKVILELKDKLVFKSKAEENIVLSQTSAVRNIDNSVRDDAVAALVALGYSPSEAMKAVKDVEITPDMTSEDVLRLGLKHII